MRAKVAQGSLAVLRSVPSIRKLRRLATAIVASGVLAHAAVARAQSTSAPTRLSPYENETLEAVLRERHATIDPAAEGKIVEGIDVEALEVIEPRDPAPRFLNALHATTREDAIRREVLLAIGEPYRQYRVDETVRDLRSFAQLSLVLAVATRGSRPDRVRLLVITKDVWSLRAQWEFRAGSSGIDLLRIEPNERNLAGTLDTILSRFELYPETITLGGGVFVPRLGGQRLYMVAQANGILTRDSGSPEGTTGTVAISTPQLSADTPWVGQVSSRWANAMVRRYVGARLATFDAPSTPEAEAVPDLFRTRSIIETASLTRSFGSAHKIDLQAGAELNVRQSVGLDPASHPAAVVADYERLRVPTNDRRAGPYVQARAYESRFLRIHDADLLGLAEDYRVGYDAWVRAYPVTRALGSSRDFVGLDAFAQYVLPIRDGYARATAEALVELEAHDAPVSTYAANAAITSPTAPFGRLVVDGLAIVRPRNYLNVRSSLGGEGRLRGYPSAALLGENLLAYNAELRTRPVEILKVQLGAAAFFDVGDAFDDGARPQLKSSVGGGVRVLFPQLDRKVWRLDVAVPLVRATGSGPVTFYIAFEQAFPSGAVTPPGAGPILSILNPLGGALGL